MRAAAIGALLLGLLLGHLGGIMTAAENALVGGVLVIVATVLVAAGAHQVAAAPRRRCPACCERVAVDARRCPRCTEVIAPLEGVRSTPNLALAAAIVAVFTAVAIAGVYRGRQFNDAYRAALEREFR